MVTVCEGVNGRHDSIVVSECVYRGPLVFEGS